jgi:hypothetical protein
MSSASSSRWKAARIARRELSSTAPMSTASRAACLPLMNSPMPASKMRASAPLWSRLLLALWCRVCRLPPAQKLRSNCSVCWRAARIANILRKI